MTGERLELPPYYAQEIALEDDDSLQELFFLSRDIIDRLRHDPGTVVETTTHMKNVVDRSVDRSVDRDRKVKDRLLDISVHANFRHDQVATTTTLVLHEGANDPFSTRIELKDTMKADDPVGIYLRDEKIPDYIRLYSEVRRWLCDATGQPDQKPFNTPPQYIVGPLTDCCSRWENTKGIEKLLDLKTGLLVSGRYTEARDPLDPYYKKFPTRLYTVQIVIPRKIISRDDTQRTFLERYVCTHSPDDSRLLGNSSYTSLKHIIEPEEGTEDPNGIIFKLTKTPIEGEDILLAFRKVSNDLLTAAQL